jgi:hypothetical protein
MPQEHQNQEVLMREMRRALLVLVPLILLLPAVATAQYMVLHDVQGSAGGTASGSHNVWFTAGEMQIHYKTGPDNTVLPGFWQIAGLASTVDVAIASFAGCLSHGAVELTWTASAAGSFDGFNVYRGEGESPAHFERLNERPFGSAGTNIYLDESALPGRTYTYQVGGVQGDREFLSFTLSVSVPEIPLTLYQNYPNPFNPSTSISFYMPGPGRVRLDIFDVQGRRIRTLADSQFEAGRHTVHWNGLNDAGAGVSSGVYLYRLVTGKSSLTRKLVMMR